MATYRTLPPGFSFAEWAAHTAARRNARRRSRGLPTPSPTAATTKPTAPVAAAAPGAPAASAPALHGTRENPQVVRVQPIPMQPSEFDRVRNLARRLDEETRLELINEIIPAGVEQCGTCHKMAFSCAMFPLNPYGEYLQCRRCAADAEEQRACQAAPASSPKRPRSTTVSAGQ